ncbi:MAG TPA: hypothetical protein PKA20_07690 [Burkholderiaceae bacterium]|nr:hypothetical protein [Burkholderiaceae bacterium]
MSTQSAPGSERDSAIIVVLRIDASRSQFVLFSARGRLLLRSGPIANGSMAEAIDEFQRHCGIRGFYRLRAAPGGWVIELRSTQQTLLAVSGHTLVDDELAQVTIQLALRQGPFARIGRGPGDLPASIRRERPRRETGCGEQVAA